MPNYQNNMRYGRQGNMRRPCGQNAGYGMQQSEGRCSTQHAMQQPEGRCSTQYAMQQPEGRCSTQHTMQQPEGRCSAPGPMARADRIPERDESCCTPAPKPKENFCPVNEGAERRVRDNSRSCGCRREDPLYGMPLAMAYVPWQTWGDTFDLCGGFQTGTIFKELDKPFLGRGGWKR